MKEIRILCHSKTVSNKYLKYIIAKKSSSRSKWIYYLIYLISEWKDLNFVNKKRSQLYHQHARVRVSNIHLQATIGPTCSSSAPPKSNVQHQIAFERRDTTAELQPERAEPRRSTSDTRPCRWAASNKAQSRIQDQARGKQAEIANTCLVPNGSPRCRFPPWHYKNPCLHSHPF